MTTSPEKWAAVKELFEAAMEQHPARRSSFIDERCSDAGVRAEVERLLAEHDQAGTFLSTPVMDAISPEEETVAVSLKMEPGMLLAGRFRIVRFIAAGGMGEVYEAQDEELREQVAIKTIRPEILRQPNTMARFRREVHLSRKVTHPNVCRIFDIFRHKSAEGDEIVFISMELLHGETLGSRLKSGEALTVTESLPIVQQMAAALAAAHAVGVVHRDFKPQNVVLVGSDPQKPRAVVTDFGLALHSENPGESVSLSTGPALVGTPAYMSPEQLEGRVATPASDIYALGLVIYEMVTGGRPFQGDTPMSAALKRLSETPMPPGKLKSGISPQWESVILRCLERNPPNRFQNAEDVAKALSGDTTVFSRTVAVPRRPSRRTVAVACSVLLFMAVGVGYGLWRWKSGNAAKAKINLRPSVAVLGFKNLSERPDEDWLSLALSDLLTTQLAAGEQVRTVPGEDLAQMKLSLGLKDADGYGKDTLSRIQRVIEADKVLVGSYLALGHETGGKIHLDLKLQDVSAGETVAAIVEDGTEDQLPELVSRTCAALLDRLGVRGLTVGDKNELEASVSSTPAANQQYAEGLAKLRTFDALGARDHLLKAVQIDDSFALAHSALSQAWSRLGYDSKAKDEAKRALDLSAGLSREERLVIESRYRSVVRDWPNAIELAKTLHTFFPDDLEYGLLLATVQNNGGKTSDALATVEELRKLPAPLNDDPRIDLKEADVRGSMGDAKDKLIAARKAEEKANARGMSLMVASARYTVGGALYDLGQTKDALAAYQEALGTYQRFGDRRQVADSYYTICEAHEDMGQFAEARKTGEQALAIYREIGDINGQALILNEIAIILRHSGDLSGGLKMADQSYALKKEVDDKHGMIAARGNRANILEDLGDLQGALHTYEEILQLSRDIGNKRFESITMGNIANMRVELGDINEGRKEIQDALAMSRQIGNKFSHVWQLGTLASLEVNAGNLDAADKAADDALTTARSADENPYVAMALGFQAQIAFERNDLSTAAQRYQEASSAYQKSGEKNAQAQIAAGQAGVSLEQGNLTEAERFARQAVEELDKEKAETAALAHASLGQVLLAQGKNQEAKSEASRARQMVLKSQNLTISIPVLIAAAEVAGKTGSATAAAELQKILQDCRRYHFLDDEFEARRALGEVDLLKDRKAGLAVLAALQMDAQSKGFLRLSKKAEAAINKAA